MPGQSAGAAEDVRSFDFVGLGEIAGANDLIAMDGQESFDHAEHETDAFFAVLEDESSGGQAAATPSLNGFAGDVEPLGDIVDGHHGFGREGFVQIERFAELFDQQSQIVLEGHAGQQGLRRSFWG